uniref:SEFIR domain-containing protein n=1 Tax=Cacopsylla melanoneura TaxID=428564 RepID=A0A8D8VHG3_9HEMI
MLYSFLVGFLLSVDLVFSELIHSPTSGLCHNQNVSCSMQLPEFFEEELYDLNDLCYMYQYENAQECRDHKSKPWNRDNATYHLGTIQLSTYLFVDKNYRMTAFNITFHNISWLDNLIWFQQYALDPPSEPQSCRLFQLSRPVSFTALLYYDCVWSLRSYEDKNYTFQSLAFNTNRSEYNVISKYVFKVPNSDRIDLNRTTWHKWELFLYVDISVEPYLTLNIQLAPSDLNISLYIMQLHRHQGANSWVVFTQQLTVQEAVNDLLSVSYMTDYKPGIYFFTVVPVHERCGQLAEDNTNKCYRSQTPDIPIRSAGPAYPILICIVGSVVLTPILILIFFLLRRQLHPPDEPEKSPHKVLVIYNVNCAYHVKVVKELMNYLQDICNIEVLLDEQSIPDSDTKDPMKWYFNAFHSAQYVIVFASPPNTSSKISASIYLGMEAYAVSLLRHRLVQIPCMTRFLTVMLPYCSSDALPMEAANFTRFHLLDDLDKLIIFLKEDRLPFFPLHVDGGKKDLSSKAPQLLEYIEEATHASQLPPQYKTASEMNHIKVDQLRIIEEKENLIKRDKDEDKDKECTSKVVRVGIEQLNLLGEEEVNGKSRTRRKHDKNTISVDDLDLL